MSTLELRSSLIEQLNQIDDERLLTRIKNLINNFMESKERKRYPAQMTIEELKEILKKSQEESRLGLGMTTEELRKRHPLCE